jgi:hypothetical protein
MLGFDFSRDSAWLSAIQKCCSVTTLTGINPLGKFVKSLRRNSGAKRNGIYLNIGFAGRFVAEVYSGE